LGKLNKKELGSKTAKGGFKNEELITSKFNNYIKDKDAKNWLKIMGYNYKKIHKLIALQIPVRLSKKSLSKYGLSEKDYETITKFKKADVQVKIIIEIDGVSYIENISLKKANETASYNQVDKRTVDSYQKMWGFDDKIAQCLKLFTGELNPKEYRFKNTKKENRIFLNELPKKSQKMIIDFFRKNKILIIGDILKGRGGLSADWMLITKQMKNGDLKYILKDINFVMNFYSQGDVKISPRGSLYIGRITMQRKGGTPDPTKLQFKISPNKLFEVE
jgi:hypothetical protein